MPSPFLKNKNKSAHLGFHWVELYIYYSLYLRLFLIIVCLIFLISWVLQFLSKSWPFRIHKFILFIIRLIQNQVNTYGDIFWINIVYILWFSYHGRLMWWWILPEINRIWLWYAWTCPRQCTSQSCAFTIPTLTLGQLIGRIVLSLSRIETLNM